MADFDPPFAEDGERRLPTSTERETGFPCGPADRALFNGLLHRVESEIGEVIGFAGIAPTDDRHTLLREAIQNLISAATGGGDVSQYLLVAQARTRLPIFPEVQTAQATLGVTSPGVGQVRVPGGVTFLHRGIFPVVTVQTDLATDASKSYHLRWNTVDGFTLKDLASPVYNPGGVAESSAVFDSTYDDMLVARVITNSSNILTITNLANKPTLASASILVGTDGLLVGVNGANFRFQKTLNWARTPDSYSLDLAQLNYDQVNASGDRDYRIFAFGLPRTLAAIGGHPVTIPLNRYGIDAVIMQDGAASMQMQFTARA